MTAPYATQAAGDTFRILANQPDTVVNINGNVVATLGAGDFSETILTAASVITANNPILVAQFSNGIVFEDTVNPNILGDPSEAIVAPTDEFASSYVIGIPYWSAENFSPAYINLTVPTAAVGLVLEDGVPVPASSYTPIGTSGYSYAQIPVTFGNPVSDYVFNTAGSNVNFGLTEYGFYPADAFALPGGYQIVPAQTTSLALSPASETDNVGAQASVTATVLDQNQQPMVGIPVTFTVTGSNPQTGTVLTNGAGQAIFTYRGTAAGNDLITASDEIAGEPETATASKEWAQVTPTIVINSPRAIANSRQAAPSSSAVRRCQGPGCSHRRRDGQRPTRRRGRRCRRFLHDGHSSARPDDVDVRRDRRAGRHRIDDADNDGSHAGPGDSQRQQSVLGRELPGKLLSHIVR